MIPRTLWAPWPNRYLALLAAILSAFTLATCGGGGGSGPGPDPAKITISGVVDDESAGTPISEAECRFVDTDGNELDSDLCGDDGGFELEISPGVRGYILCSPPSIPNLNLSTFSSTIDLAAGTTITNENVTPTTTLASDIIRYEAPSDPEARKAELLYTLATGQDPSLELAATMAARLFQTMLARQVNLKFGGDQGESGVGDSGDGDGDGGGVGGEAGDGADFSPLPQAECTFFVGDSLITAAPLYPSALADYWADGQLNRPDLADLEEEVHQGLAYSAEEIQEAFAQVFSQGPGLPITSLTDDQGRYFLPIPAKVDGYVRCRPQGHENLVLGAFVPARQEGEVREDEDVTPATTVFGTHIAPQLERDLATVRENYLDDMDGLITLLSGPNLPDGPLTDINLASDTRPANSEVGLVAFSVTALFNALYKEGHDVDFLAAIADLTAQETIDPAFLETLGVPADQTQPLATLVNGAIGTTATTLNTDLATALSTARVKLTVMTAETDGGEPIPGAVVAIQDCQEAECSLETDDRGEVTLTLGASTEEVTAVDLTISAEPGFAPVSAAVEVVALAFVEAVVALSAQTGTLSGAVMDALEGTPLAGARVSVYDEGRVLASDTTDSQGRYTIQCAIGSNYTLSIEMDGYIATQYNGVTVSADSTTFMETALQVKATYAGRGNIAGTIRSALNNSGIEGVSLELRAGINTLTGAPQATATTATGGDYRFNDIPAGVYTVSASHGGYLQISFTVFSAGEQTIGGQDGSMSPQLDPGAIRVVLRWGAAPADLDSHLTGPASTGGSFHCYYGDQSPDPAEYVHLDLDDRYGYGPETTTIVQLLPGTYQYLVHDYANRASTSSSALSNSGAQVTVYGDAGELASFNVPAAQGGTVWTVFELDGTSGQITPLNSVSYGSEPVSVRQLWGENETAPLPQRPLFEELPEK